MPCKPPNNHMVFKFKLNMLDCTSIDRTKQTKLQITQKLIFFFFFLFSLGGNNLGLDDYIAIKNIKSITSIKQNFIKYM